MVALTRLLLSRRTADELGTRIAQVFGSRPFEILTPPGGLARDFDCAFVSRDITGRSTKLELEPATKEFHDALRQAKSLRWVHIHSAGTDRPIYPELQARGVLVTPSAASTAIVAQTALAGILALARRLPLLMEQQRAREWKSLMGRLPPDLAGQTAAIVGWGPIGQTLAAWLVAIGLTVRVVRNSDRAAGSHATFAYDRIRDAASRADWLVIACPLTERTEKLVDAEVLGSLAPGAHVVNVGRGEVVVEADLIAALRDGQIGGAFLDVFEHEPLASASPLWSMPNVIVTPHTAGHSAGNQQRVAELFLENLQRFVAGELA